MNRSDFLEIHDAAADLLRRQQRVTRLQAEPAGQPPDREQWRQLAEAGWFRLLLAEEYGGLGLDAAALGAVFLATGAEPVRGPLLQHAVTVPLLRSLATGGQAATLDAALEGALLLGVADGDAAGNGVHGGDAVDVVDAVDDPHRMAGVGLTRGAPGLRLEEGRLRGVAELVSFGQWAEALIVVARAAREPVLLLLPADLARREPLVCVDPAAAWCRMVFDDVAVAPDAVLLRGAAVTELLARNRALQRLMVAAELAGGAARMVAMSVEYARTRRQFGRPIGSFQALQHMLAEMSAKAAALHSLVLATLADAVAQPGRLTELGLIAKAQACRTGRELSQEALQVHGGIGFTAELSLHLHMRRVFTHQGQLGESDALLTELGERTLNAEEWV